LRTGASARAAGLVLEGAGSVLASAGLALTGSSSTIDVVGLVRVGAGTTRILRIRLALSPLAGRRSKTARGDVHAVVGVDPLDGASSEQIIDGLPLARAYRARGAVGSGGSAGAAGGGVGLALEVGADLGGAKVAVDLGRLLRAIGGREAGQGAAHAVAADLPRA